MPLPNFIFAFRCHLTSFGQNSSRLAYFVNFKNRRSLINQFQSQISKSKFKAFEDRLAQENEGLFHRMKTVLGHAIMRDGSGTLVYNCKFDLQGRFIITAADDG